MRPAFLWVWGVGFGGRVLVVVCWGCGGVMCLYCLGGFVFDLDG